MKKVLLGILLYSLINFPLHAQLSNLPKIMKNEQPTIVYFYDALCGWCYGFSPVISQLQKNYSERIKFEVISGGMITGDRQGPIGEVAPYIKTAYKTVEDHTGVEFGEGFLKGVLEPGTAYFSSIKPSIALTVFKQLRPNEAVSFASALQKAIYYDGIQPDKFEEYKVIAESFGLPGQDFVERMKAPSALEATQKEFALSSSAGVRGFPTVVFIQGEKATLLSNGYQTYKELEKNLLKLLDQNK